MKRFTIVFVCLLTVSLSSLAQTADTFDLATFRWSLLLTPVDGIETKRDGVFSFIFNGENRKTYSYAAVNANGELVP